MHLACPFDRVNGQKRNGMLLLVTVSCAVIGFLMGAECCEKSLYAHAAKRILNDE
jgi:hypothetical protein